ncbi:hypothetical protein KIS1582_4307 [Cytobacillus firmus]|uniref:Uncharacterized protein n=1 Tax=Cytobacillus firmus TaxID=1399 RepID=A0A800MSZ3_CYTFI|nr:hypothetical protein KIS1582_4307 [Cytobacillus firmus]
MHSSFSIFNINFPNYYGPSFYISFKINFSIKDKFPLFWTNEDLPI